MAKTWIAHTGKSLVVEAILGRPWKKLASSALVVFGWWDLFGAQFLSEHLGSRLPRIYDLVATTTALLPWWAWAWILVLLTFIWLATVEHILRAIEEISARTVALQNLEEQVRVAQQSADKVCNPLLSQHRAKQVRELLDSDWLSPDRDNSVKELPSHIEKSMWWMRQPDYEDVNRTINRVLEQNNILPASVPATPEDKAKRRSIEVQAIRKCLEVNEALLIRSSQIRDAPPGR